MDRIPHLKALAAVCTLQLLSGCVAAAAVVPLLAGGGLVGSRVVGNNPSNDVADAAIPRPPFDRAVSTRNVPSQPVGDSAIELLVEPVPEPVAQLGLRPTETVAEVASPPATNIPTASLAATKIAPANRSAVQSSGELVPAAQIPATQVQAAQSAPTPPPIARPEIAPIQVAEAPLTSAAPGSAPPIELTLPDGRTIALSAESTGGISAGLPASTQTAAAFSTVDARAYDGLLSYAMEQSQAAKIGERRKSVLLVAPGALKPETSQCGVSQPAILIDLDPGETLLDISTDFAPNAPLAATLAVLRTRNVSVHWLSGNSAAEAGALRQRLAESGLDPDGRDELVLMRYPDDRKQVRRRAVGATHCLIAIAGEERRDFDELYGYLKSRDSALALESLVGNGWFLVPPALATPASAPPALATEDQ